MKRTDALLLAAFAALAVPVYGGTLQPRAAAAGPLEMRAPAILHATPRKWAGGDPAGEGEDTFDHNSLFRYTGYTDRGENWRVLGGSLVGTGPAVQSVLIRTDKEMANGWVEAMSSRADDGGIVLRFTSPRDYYLLAFRDDDAPPPRGAYNLALYHHEGSAYHEMWHGDVRWERGTSHAVRFEAEGPWLRAYFDSALAGEVTLRASSTDLAPSITAGGFGVRSYGADATWINKFTAFRWHEAAQVERK